ncbi:MAG: hypothetical protein ACE5J3_08730 [Methanosarcinales archaeon]
MKTEKEIRYEIAVTEQLLSIHKKFIDKDYVKSLVGIIACEEWIKALKWVLENKKVEENG